MSAFSTAEQRALLEGGHWFTLPFPPSTNTYYRKFRNRMVISAGGRKYKEWVRALLAHVPGLPLPGRVQLAVELYPPDRRRRDLDNFCGKALLDALKGVAFGDDSEVFLLAGEWGVTPEGELMVVKDGRLEVHLQRLENKKNNDSQKEHRQDLPGR